MGPGVVRPRWRVTVGVVVEGWGEDGLRALRGALHAQDGVALPAALRRGPVREVLQLAGDGVAGAAAQGLPGAAEMAALFLGALQERGFRGDEELGTGCGRPRETRRSPSCARSRSIWRCSPCCWRATRPSPVAGSICPPGSAGLLSPMSWGLGPRPRRTTIPSDGCTSRLWVPGPVTGTWSCSSKRSRTPPLPTGCGSHRWAGSLPALQGRPRR